MFVNCESSSEGKALAAGACTFVGAMAAAKIKQFLCGDNPKVLALTGPAGCGKRYTIAEAARQAGVAVTHHDLSQGAVDWERLGKRQLTREGLVGSVHVISNASQDFVERVRFCEAHSGQNHPRLRRCQPRHARKRASHADAAA